MAKKIILKSSDVEQYADISDNYEESRFNVFALRAQETQLRELLGDALYYALINDLDVSGVPQSAPYTTLVNGESYTYDNETVEYFGLKPFLAFHWLAINNREGDIRQADYGNIMYSDNPQDNMTKMSKSQKDEVNASYMSSSVSYRNNIVQYLNEKDDDYPTWEGRCENKPNTSFNIMTI